MPERCRWIAGVLAGLLGTSPLLPAEEALLRDGRRVTGTLLLQAGQLRFQSAGRDDPIAPADLQRVRFADTSPESLRTAWAHRFHLSRSEYLTGEVLDIGRRTLAFRTGWASRLELPRGGVAIGPLPGWRTAAVDTFQDGLKGWTVQGKPALVAPGEGRSGQAVVLPADDCRLTYTLAAPLPAGRVGIDFQEQDHPGGAVWQLEAVFAGDPRPYRLRLIVAGRGESPAVGGEGLSVAGPSPRRGPGWHRLVLTFSAGTLRVCCAGDVLGYSLKQGPGGSLERIELSCEPAAAGRGRGRVAWTAFSIEREVQERPRPGTDPNQDEVWLDTGDQLFGTIVRGSSRELTLEGRLGTRTFPWLELQGCTFRQAAGPVRSPAGPRARVRLHSGRGPEPDLLEGSLRQLDEQRVVLDHAVLGELTIPRAWLISLDPVPARTEGAARPARTSSQGQ